MNFRDFVSRHLYQVLNNEVWFSVSKFIYVFNYYEGKHTKQFLRLIYSFLQLTFSRTLIIIQMFLRLWLFDCSRISYN